MGIDLTNQERALVERLREVFGREYAQGLVEKRYRIRPGAPASTGFCYLASEILFHALGGKSAGYKPCCVRHEGGTHWFLRRSDDSILDATSDQFSTQVPYPAAVGKGFLTKGPSRRARKLADLAGISFGEG